jgi:hypothetical protein
VETILPASLLNGEELEVKRRPLAFAGVAMLALAIGVVLMSVNGSAGKATRQVAVHEESEGLVSEGTDRVEADRGVQDRRVASARAATGSFGPNVLDGKFDGESPAVISLPVVPAPPATSIKPRDNESLQPPSQGTNAKDPVVQKKKGTGPISAPIQNFDGICLPFSDEPCAQGSNCSCLPPDTNGEAGLTQYVEMVNTSFAVYSKTGTLLRPATETNQLWANTDSECKTHNDGDPVVVYDQLANRWLLTQFINAGSGEQYGECVAISTTGDATGSYYLYTFLFGSDVFYDYPKIGVWPDGYYMIANEFPTSMVTSAGTGAFVFERSKMLQGAPARVVFFDESLHNPSGGQYIGQLPGDLDGSVTPPAGTPNLFAEVDDPAGIPPTAPGDTGFDMRLWRFHVDWSNPANSTFGKNGSPNFTLPVAPFIRNQCVYGHGDCVPQKGGPEQLDVLGDRLMFRMPIRVLNGTESVLLNHTVQANDGPAGIRWYEVRVPKSGAASIYQQGTYAPTDAPTNPLWRWMGSLAMDRIGDIAVGFSASGPNDFPSVRYTGRAVGDPLGQMTQTELVAWTGSGPQTQVEGRWGDYSDLSVDPSDDCTFWYTQEYLGTDLIFGAWRTRIASFKFPGCRK